MRNYCLTLTRFIMIKNIKVQLFFLFACFIFMNSCNKDEGNYDYVEINEVVFEGLLEDYTVSRFDNLVISTDEVKYTKDTDGTGNYEYSWEAVSDNFLDDNIYVISTEKDMNQQMLLKPGVYTLFYLVKDLNTDVEFQYQTKLNVVNSIYQGWMVLNDVDGEPRLDMISLLDGEYKEVYNVLAGSSLTLTGKPGFVECYPYQPSFYGVYVSTSGNGTTKLEPDTFDWGKTNNISYEFVSSQPEDLEVTTLYPRGNYFSVVMANSGFYVYNRVNNVYYSTPQNVRADGISFEVSPHISTSESFGVFKMVFYDNTNKKFVYHNNYTSNCFDVTSTAPVFTPGKDLKYMVWNSYGGMFGTTFAILKDPSDGKNYIGMFESNSFTQSHYSEIKATNFDQAEHIAIDPTYAYIMYNIGSKVYEYDVFTGTTVEMLDKGGLEITKLEYRKFFKSANAELAKQLIVCTYDASGTKGSNGIMELYNVPAIQGQLELNTSFSGFGKIVSVAYRER
ncbi:hypothetical protein EC396_13690 [Lutibacter sp. HS1-25]|nr:hypothetical protein EC396_13690 [Lutibacter sp. HS1-25]